MKKISEWLDPGDGSERHKDLTGQRTADTGTWFLESVEFQTWIKGDCDVLFCHGKGFSLDTRTNHQREPGSRS